jgi:hypothetical protein
MNSKMAWALGWGVWVWLAGGCGPSAKPGNGDGTAGKPTREAAMRDVPAPDSLASVEQVLAARTIRPDETLAVHLRGIIGSDGSWALDRIDVRAMPGGALVIPRVRRVPGDMFIQMVIPLDTTVRVALPAGTQRVTVLGREGEIPVDVEVTTAARRTVPMVRIDAASAVEVGGDAIVPLHVEASVADGWVERVELREVTAGESGAWQAPEMVEPTPTGLRASFSVRRPAGDPARHVEVRAIDGQGVTSEPSRVDLPPRAAPEKGR